MARLLLCVCAVIAARACAVAAAADETTRTDEEAGGASLLRRALLQSEARVEELEIRVAALEKSTNALLAAFQIPPGLEPQNLRRQQQQPPPPSARSRKQDSSCQLGDLSDHLDNVALACCPGNDCSTTSYPGADSVCVPGCGTILEPFWDDCGQVLTLIGSVPEGLPQFYDTCMAGLYPPGQCGSVCSLATFHCRAMEITNACCSDPLNCPSRKATPTECPIGCSLLFPAFVDECGNSDNQWIPEDEMREYNMFAETCREQDPADVLEYANDLISAGCTLELPSPTNTAPPRVLPPSTPLFEPDAWLTRIEGTCVSPTELVHRLREVQHICCDADACRDLRSPGVVDLVLPTTCSPECALLFHAMIDDCGFVLSYALPEEVRI